MFQSMIEKQLMDFIEKMDLNHDKIPDKQQLEPLVAKAAKALADAGASVNWAVVMASLDSLEDGEKSAVKLAEPLVKDAIAHKSVDISKVIQVLSTAEGKQLVASVFLSAHNLIGAVDRAKLKVAIQEAVEAKAAIDAFLHPAKKVK